MNPPARIAIAWSGLPAYAARLVRAGMDAVGEPVAVIGTRPLVPIAGMESILRQPVAWIREEDRPTWAGLGLAVPRRFLHTGWAYPCFNGLADEVRAAGGRVAIFVDNRFRDDLRQRVGARVFRWRLRDKVGAIMVPGRSGRRLLDYFAYPPDRVVEGLYGADPAVFRPGPPLASRPGLFLFVGQLIDRKGLPELLEGFAAARRVRPDLRLHLVGQGPLAGLAASVEGVTLEAFQQPDVIERRLHAHRFLVLPSRRENWGVVVHEAALCGCGLVLADQVAAGDDLLDPGANGVRHVARSAEAIARALLDAASWDELALERAEAVSLDRARAFGPARWARGFAEVLAKLED